MFFSCFSLSFTKKAGNKLVCIRVFPCASAVEHDQFLLRNQFRPLHALIARSLQESQGGRSVHGILCMYALCVLLYFSLIIFQYFSLLPTYSSFYPGVVSKQRAVWPRSFFQLVTFLIFLLVSGTGKGT